MPVTPNLPEILAQIADEFTYQDAASVPLKDGTSSNYKQHAQLASDLAVVQAAVGGGASWVGTMSIPYFRAAATVGNDRELRFELVKLAALAVGWVNEIDKRN